MTLTFNPNIRRTPRSQQRNRCLAHGHQPNIHPLVRTGHEAYYQRLNPNGYQHDLGAQDLFLDDLGLLFFEQLDSHLHPAPYFSALWLLLARWEALERAVYPDEPHWGKYLNARTRRANSGEPRSLLRLDLGTDQLDTSLRLEVDDGRSPDRQPFDYSFFRERIGRSERFWSADFDIPWLWRVRERSRYRDWDPYELLPDDVRFRDSLPPTGEYEERATGLLIEGMGPRVGPYGILPLEYATPDLPPSVGATPAALKRFSRFVRDQGSHPTCAAFAFCTALDILRNRAEGGRTTGLFCPADLHLRLGSHRWNRGRTLAEIASLVSQELPVLPPSRYPLQTVDPDQLLAEVARARAQYAGLMQTHYGPAWIRKLDVHKIPELKAHLAAGWVLVVGTALTREAMQSNALRRYGYPLRPLPGQNRIGGHAWTVVGYEHVDGNQQWKYQGRFIALNSWGRSEPSDPVLGPGLVSLPFSFVYSEGSEAYAIRLPSLEPMTLPVAPPH